MARIVLAAAGNTRRPNEWHTRDGLYPERAREESGMTGTRWGRALIHAWAAVAVATAGGCGGDSSRDMGHPATGGSAGAMNGTGSIGGDGGASEGSGGAAGGAGGSAGGIGGSLDCLGPDAPGTGGYAGGACEGVFSTWCMDRESGAYRACTWLMYAARQSVFEAVRECLENTPDPCSGDTTAALTACTDDIYAQACLAPGTTVDGQEVDCGVVSSTCPDVTGSECDRLMSILNESRRQRAYECYFRDESAETDCAAAFDDCVYGD
jgi:hypothetical protein